MNLAEIIKTMTLVGAQLPAYKALFDSVKSIFGEQDQAKLQEAYEAALTRADAAHARAQSLGEDTM